MRQFDCPQCSAPIPFQTPGAVFAVCGSCQSMVVRNDIALEAIGKMSDFPPDRSPLQIGARGRHRGRSFLLLGRLRIGWDGGSWSEWYVDFGEGRHGWVAESQGFFEISEAAPMSSELKKKISLFQPNQKVEIGGVLYSITGNKSIHVISGEGELPFVAQPGENWMSYDLVGNNRQFASVEWHDSDSRLYLGSSAQPEEIEWDGLKAVPGWNGEPLETERNRTNALNCVACGGVVQLKAAGLSQTLACSHCGTLLDIHKPEAIVAQKVNVAAKQLKTLIPLGRRGTLRGVEWEAIGSITQWSLYGTWDEILLYNPWHGFAWLTEHTGHWNFIRRMLDHPESAYSSVTVQGNSYDLFSRDETKVLRVAGEFYWKVRIGDISTISDFVAPPRVISRETYPNLQEMTWSEGEYIDAQEVGKAFQVNFPKQSSTVYQNQPNPWKPRLPSLKMIAVYALIVAILVQVISVFSKSSKHILAQDFQYEKPVGIAAEAPPIVTSSFDLKGSQSPATIQIHAPVENAWLGFDADLVNEKTGKVYPSEAIVEYYYGYDGDSWKEGKQEASSDLPAVPPGRYHLALSPVADESISSLQYQVQLQHGGLFWSNFLICLLAIGIWPLWAYFRYYYFESRRWSQSDYGANKTINFSLGSEE
jgi:hypothetical protein